MPDVTLPKLRLVPKPGAHGIRSLPNVYAELLVATNFTFLKGASHASELVARACELGYKAIGVTDINSFAGIVRMHGAAKETGMKLIVGTRLVFTDHPDIAVYPINRAAYGQLCKLLTLGKRRTVKGECELHIADFLENCADMHAILIPPEVHSEKLLEQARTLKTVLGKHISIAAFALFEGDNQMKLKKLDELARAAEIPLVASNDAHYHVPERRPLQDILTCIRHGCAIHEAGFKLFQNGERYLKSSAQMQALFTEHPQAIERGIEIAAQCTFNLDELRYEYPQELAPAGRTPLEHLTDLAWSGAKERYPAGIPEKVRNAVEHELKLIAELKIEAYFLTVHDLVRFARSRDILCQGRGSAANSAVCYCIGVTSVDPDRVDLLFERFVSSARGEPPDIDVDFEHERREEVIQYVYEKYGRERSGMTGVVTTYRGRSAVRDVGKALGLGLDTVDQMAKRLDWWDSGKISTEKIRELGLDPDDFTVRAVLNLTAEILGFPRHLSQHVGGMVMTRGLLCELVPIENASMEDRTVIEWDKNDIDELGILKVDILALGMLTCIAKCLRLINDRDPHDAAALMRAIPPEDPHVYEMIQDADTVGVFQIESRAQMSMLPRLLPKNFYDLVIEVAIVRPGPIQGDMVHPYLRRRNGEEEISYPSEALKQVLGKTLGVPLFQEQAMKISMVAAGFTAEEADKLRRAMAAWRRNGDIEKFQRKIIDGMTGNGYTQQFAEQCFNQLKGFGEYGFPESHAASFALLVYVSAWIKRYHPAAFCCGLLNSQPMGFYAAAQLVRDAQTHGVTVLPTDINYSDFDSALAPPQNVASPDVIPKWNWGEHGPSVRLGLNMVRGLSEAHAQHIEKIRKEIGIFKSFDYFLRSVRLPSSVLRKLAKADCFQSFALSRRQALWKIMEYRSEQLPLFEDLEPPVRPVALPIMPITKEVTIDYQTAGLSLKRHPVALLRNELTRMKVTTAGELAELPHGRRVKVAGLVLIRQRPGTASGIVFETLEDETGVVNLILHAHIYERFRRAARHSALPIAEGSVERQGKVVHVLVKKMEDASFLLAGCENKSRDFH